MTSLSPTSIMASAQTSVSQPHQRLKKKLHTRFQRTSQLKVLTMLGMIRAFKKLYEFQWKKEEQSQEDSEIQDKTDPKEKMAYEYFSEFQSAVVRKLTSLKKQQGVLQHFRSSTFMTSAISSQLRQFNKTHKNNKSTANTSIFTMGHRKHISSDNFQIYCKQKYKQEVNYFKAINRGINLQQKGSLLAQSKQNITVLKELMNRLKYVIFKHYRTLERVEQNDPSKLETIRFYCQASAQAFGALNRTIKKLINQKEGIGYKQLMQRIQPIRKKNQKQNGIKHQLQDLLLIFVESSQLNTAYQCSHHTFQLQSQRGDEIRSTVSIVIRLRHLLGYLNQQIINLCGISGKDKAKRDEPVWKSIFDRKYSQTTLLKQRRKAF